VGDAEGIREMYAAALDAVTDSDRAAVLDPISDSLVGNNYNFSDPDEVERVGRVVAELIATAGKSEATARRLNDLAVAGFLLGESVAPDDDGESARALSISLLETTASAFPDDPAVAVNLAYFRSLVGPTRAGLETMVDDLAGYVRRHPDDLTARLLLGSLEARRWDRDGLSDALTTLQPLVDEPETESIGRLSVGDAYVAHVQRWRDVQPERGDRLARLAIESYDAVLAGGGLAAAFAGRAHALDQLGLQADALTSMRAAVALNEDSAARWVDVARLERCLGDNESARRDARIAADKAEQSNSLLRDGRLVEGEPAEDLGVDRGFGGVGLGSGRPSRPATSSAPGTGGGFLVDPFGDLERAACLGSEQSDPLTSAQSIVRETSIALGDVAAVAGDREGSTDETVLAARLVAGASVADGPFDSGAVLRAAPFLAPGRAAELCRAILPTASPEFDLTAVLACILRGSSRARSPDAIVDGLIRLTPWLSESGEGDAFLEGAGALWGLGRVDDAERFYRVASQVPEIAPFAFARLGDIRLDAGDAAGAVPLYDLALGTAEAREAASSRQDDPPSMRLRRLVQGVRNNRGAARLDQLRPEPLAAPDCTSQPAACRRSADDFAAARASDPDHWLYEWNEGWIRRLLGDEAAAEASLARAVSLKPDNAGAVNDLAVLRVRGGDADEARRMFAMAASMDERFDLAAWNLGVLESRDPVTMASGQWWLAEAVKRNPRLRLAPLSFRFDDRLVRVAPDASGRLAIDRSAAAPATVAVAFGTIATVGALANLLSSIQGNVRGAATSVTESEFRRWARRLRPTARVRLLLGQRRRDWRPWFIWIPVFACLLLTTIAWVVSSARDGLWGYAFLAVTVQAAAVVTLASGHRLVASPGTRRVPTRFVRGYVLALAGFFFGAPAGPYPVENIADPEPTRAWWSSLAGPLVCLIAAVVAIGLSFVQPAPLLRTLAATQLAVAAYALMPAGALDGARLATRRPVVLTVLALVVAISSAAIAVGVV
jgi:tetratricopeptide (TPR) repeat protein